MENNIEPIFMKQRDIRSKDITAFEICQTIERVVGKGNVEGAQLANQIWRLYLKNKASRVQLLAKREFNIMNQQVPLYDKNPFPFTINSANGQIDNKKCTTNSEQW